MALIDHRIKEWVIGYLKSGNLKKLDVDELVTGIVTIVTATITTATIDTATIDNLDVTTNLDINGSLNFKSVTKTDDYTAADEIVILCNAVSNNITITLPSAATYTDRVYYIKKIDSSAYTVTIDGNGTETIDGDETQVITVQYTSLTVCSDGSNWHII